ncbi:unnamed protein product [Spirodela intermedia]|uniref:Uncharacterized protein n=2 Tax=Spirodela intermedia TaxID=51605 RepID=A0A7I8J987_SPIIN|nr:unnamed protein product [Spirodela intermedia]CAA6666654.1 unnamed protein product [Spirodela intermedia]CAA7403452.1 unnamed protein product [Spirodela intermedia]
MGDGALEDGRLLSPWPTAIFLLVGILQLIDRFIGRLKKKESRTAEENQLIEEIKELLKQASLLSTPSSFAHAAKLQRMAAAKQKELVKIQQENKKNKRVSYDSCARAFMLLKVIIYLGLSWWFWGVPIAEVPRQFLQPLGRMLSWRAADPATDVIKVGIIPWLVLTNRVSKFLSQKLPDLFL